jgi:predicted transcriptional regulator
MQNTSESASPDYPALTSDIVSAYVSHNSVPRTDLAALITSVHSALSGIAKPQQAAEPPTPPVAINKTIRPDYIVSLEDGRQYRSLKRHLTARGLTPDYPMVAPNYSKARSELARALGLGQSRKGRGGKKAARAKK